MYPDFMDAFDLTCSHFKADLDLRLHHKIEVLVVVVRWRHNEYSPDRRAPLCSRRVHSQKPPIGTKIMRPPEHWHRNGQVLVLLAQHTHIVSQSRSDRFVVTSKIVDSTAHLSG